eukprot:COSAG01_NODE_2900_length_6892_cov_34.502871_5_plen_40_part_00
MVASKQLPKGLANLGGRRPCVDKRKSDVHRLVQESNLLP